MAIQFCLRELQFHLRAISLIAHTAGIALSGRENNG
jgi:hypothetical protein